MYAIKILIVQLTFSSSPSVGTQKKHTFINWDWPTFFIADYIGPSTCLWYSGKIEQRKIVSVINNYYYSRSYCYYHDYWWRMDSKASNSSTIIPPRITLWSPFLCVVVMEVWCFVHAWLESLLLDHLIFTSITHSSKVSLGSTSRYSKIKSIQDLKLV